jgi:excinuclease ABC subunit A
MNIYYKAMLRSIAAHFNVSLETPWKNLPDDFKKVCCTVRAKFRVDFNFWRAGKMSTISRPFEGVLPNLERLFTDSESEFIRNRIKPYMSPQFCDVCKGKRLKPEILAVTLGGGSECPKFHSVVQSARNQPPLEKKFKTRPERQPTLIPGLSIMDVCALSVEKADEFFAGLKLTEFEEKIAHEVIKEIRARLGFLKNVGLGYLTLDRESGTLSGGEAQRIRLATQIGAGLVGVLYILDEPSIGLHQRDNDRLLPRSRACATSATPCSWSSTTPTPSATRITSLTSAPARAFTAANWWRRARCRKFWRTKIRSRRSI